MAEKSMTEEEQTPVENRGDDPWADDSEPSSDGAELQAKLQERRAQQEADDKEFEDGWGLSMDEPSEPAAFAEALSRARADGKASFEWQGKTYSTSEGPAAPPMKPAATAARTPVAPPAGKLPIKPIKPIDAKSKPAA